MRRISIGIILVLVMAVTVEAKWIATTNISTVHYDVVCKKKVCDVSYSLNPRNSGNLNPRNSGN